MHEQPTPSRFVVTAEDMRRGRHYRFEVQEHLYNEWFLKKHGEYPDARRIDGMQTRLRAKYKWAWLLEVTDCPVCQAHIERCRADGTDPFAPNVAVLADLNKFLKRKGCGEPLGGKSLK